MKQVKHTPGPWIYRYTAKQFGKDHPETGEHHTVIRYPRHAEDNEVTICKILSNAKPNAALIAAAPDLLKAARHTVELLISHGFSSNNSKLGKARLALERAIELVVPEVSND